MTGARILEILVEELRSVNSTSTRDALTEAIERAAERIAEEEWYDGMGDDL